MVWSSKFQTSLLTPLIFILTLMNSNKAHSLPQYAVRYGINACTACHISPAGGGPKNLNGKLFGAGGFEMNSLLQQDVVSADLRALLYYPEEATSAKGGMGVMSGSIAGHVSLDAARRLQLVIETNIAGFAQAAYRDTYGLVRFADSGTPAVFDTLLVGRFRFPFGIATDEHRTYVRFQNQTRWFDFETGAMASGNPNYELHYDIAVVNGEKSTGQSLGSGQALRWGTLANIRWMPGPFTVGLSGSYHEHEKSDENRHSASIYSTVSLGRWTNDRVPVTIQIERSLAWKWNPVLAQGFVSDSDYATALRNSASQGWLLWIEWELSRRFAFIYKYDYLTPDRDFPSDNYFRHGFGGRLRIGPNAIVQARLEFANASHPSEARGDGIGRQNAAFGILQMGF